jgi:hypothetical protein
VIRIDFVVICDQLTAMSAELTLVHFAGAADADQGGEQLRQAFTSLAAVFELRSEGDQFKGDQAGAEHVDDGATFPRALPQPLMDRAFGPVRRGQALLPACA